MIKTLLLTTLLAALAGCSQLDNYERSYGVAYQDGTQSVTGSMTLRPVSYRTATPTGK